MTTAERAAGLASAAGSFAEWLGAVDSAQLLELVRLELGDSAMLDDY